MSIPTIGIKTFFECYSEIRVRTIDVALSANLNDCVVHENDGKTQIFQRFEFLSYFTLLYFAGNGNPYNFKNTGKLSFIVRETYGKTQTFQSYGFLTYFM